MKAKSKKSSIKAQKGGRHKVRTPVAKLWKQGSIVHRIGLAILAAFLLFVLSSYGAAQWYIQRHNNEPLVYGTTFIPRYAEYFGLDPKETLDAIINDAGFKRLRLVSYWDDIEKTPGVYNFSELDWQMQKAEAAGVDVNLSVGLRQPRWPECHMPEWTKSQPYDQWYPALKNFMTATVNRYKDSPSLVSFQVENEFFMTVFGECPDFSRERLVEEVGLVRNLAPNKKIVVTRSNNWGGVPLGEPTPDVFGVAVYKRVWDENLTHRYFEYPYPPWFYSSLAGFGEMVSDKPMIIHELQMEPWMPPGKDFQINDIKDIPEQNKSMNAERLRDRFQYAEDTGIRTIDTWGAEWWYWRKVKANDPSLWNTAREELRQAQ